MPFPTSVDNALLSPMVERDSMNTKRPGSVIGARPFEHSCCVGYGLGCAVRGSLAGGSLRAGWLLLEPELDEPDELVDGRGVAVGVVVPLDADGVYPRPFTICPRCVCVCGVTITMGAT